MRTRQPWNRVGGQYDFGWGGGPIKILELEPNHKLTYSWNSPHKPEHPSFVSEDTVVTWILEDSDGGTRLTLVHSGFGKDRSTDDHRTGWLEFVNALKSMVEIGKSWEKIKSETSDSP